MNTKTKPAGEINDKLCINCNMQILNGTECFKLNEVPMIVLDYKEPQECSEFAKQTPFKFWIKLEEHPAYYQKQLNKDLKEISIWLTEENKHKLIEILKKDDKIIN